MESNELRLKRVGLSSDGSVIFCEMDNGKTYSMPLVALDRAEDWDPKAKPKSVGIIHDAYAALVEFDTGLKINFPSDFVLHICEPSYTFHKDKERATSGVGRRIREIRQARGLTLDALAAKCGIAKPNLSRLENDKVTPQFETLNIVAAALRVHPALLVSQKKPQHAWTWTRHEFTEWKLGLLWKQGSGGSPAPVRAVDMVRIFLATRPEHRYAKMKLLKHADLAPRDAELAKYPLDAEKWAREVSQPDAARESIQRQIVEAEARSQKEKMEEPMAQVRTKERPAKRQHFIARFYLRNFGEPMFSDKLCVYDLEKRRWEKRTPDGVGWFPHLCSMIDIEGNRTDEFDRYLKLNVEDPAAPALKKLATGEALVADERSSVALFIALTAARSPEMMKHVIKEHLDRLRPIDRAELDRLVKLWCQWTERPCDSKSHSEFLKPNAFGGIWIWSQDLSRRLLDWEWHLVHTTKDQPFITSDRPVFAHRDQNVHLVTFPVSSEVALIIIAGGRFNEARDRSREVYVMNRQTMHRAREFVVACREKFPADDLLISQNQSA